MTPKDIQKRLKELHLAQNKETGNLGYSTMLFTTSEKDLEWLEANKENLVALITRPVGHNEGSFCLTQTAEDLTIVGDFHLELVEQSKITCDLSPEERSTHMRVFDNENKALIWAYSCLDVAMFPANEGKYDKAKELLEAVIYGLESD